MKTLIIIPAYNEAENIKRVVDHLITNYPQHDYVVINDGSRDDTAKICRQNGYNLVDLKVNTGLAGAFQTGMNTLITRDMTVSFNMMETVSTILITLHRWFLRWKKRILILSLDHGLLPKRNHLVCA